MCLPSPGLPPSGLTTNKHRMAHALEHEPSYCLFSVVEWLAVFENREQEQKLYKMYFLSQVNRNGRAPWWTIGRHKTSFFNLFCLAVVRWADDAKVVRAWYGVCFVEAMLLALGLRQHGEVYFMVRHSILSGGNRKRMNACPPPIPSKCLYAF